jgi:acetyl esterase/lipase
VVCERDELRPSGERFAETLTEAGVDAVVHLELGAGHGHINEPGDAGALRTIEAVAEWLAGRRTVGASE